MKGWRTILLNIGVAVFAVLEAADWTAMLGNDKAAWIVAAVAGVNMALRVATNTPVGRSS